MRFIPAIRTSALLSILFLVVYGATNTITSWRHDVGSMYFEWERHIPFLPWMVIPYLSIDLFFVAAPFLCSSDDERHTFARRITTAILIAAVCFLLFPLKFSFERPQMSGWLGAVFDWFRTMDKPFNEMPSLHIALRTILAGVYARHTKGVVRWLLLVWFSLIGLSTVFTYQHHVMDVAGGFLLGILCIYLHREGDHPASVVPNRRVGGYYLTGAVLLAVCAWVLRPWGIVLLWPATSFGIVAYGYFKGGAGIYRKEDGRISWQSQVVLAPGLLGQQLSLLHYQRQCQAWDAVVPGVLIGRVLNGEEANEAVQHGVTAVLDLTGEFSEVGPFLKLNYLNVPVLDLTAPTRDQFKQAVNFIDAQSREGCVYVHCKIGYSRSAAVVMAWLIKSGRASSTDEATAVLRRVRPSVVIRPEIVPAVTDFVTS
ncbi:MAG: phosphatase PAP2/dual specificity phosphatase family protein [Verrucomicrobiota bacterium]